MARDALTSSSQGCGLSGVALSHLEAPSIASSSSFSVGPSCDPGTEGLGQKDSEVRRPGPVPAGLELRNLRLRVLQSGGLEPW